MSEVDRSVDQWGVRVAAALRDPRVFERAAPDIEQTIRTSVEQNFRVGGRWGNDNPWGGGTNSWAPTERGDRILVDTALLLNSIDIRVWMSADGLIIQISANPIYAAFHHYGTSTMEARPWAVVQTEDITMIVEILIDELQQSF